jgi:hypothetical protein
MNAKALIMLDDVRNKMDVGDVDDVDDVDDVGDVDDVDDVDDVGDVAKSDLPFISINLKNRARSIIYSLMMG